MNQYIYYLRDYLSYLVLKVCICLLVLIPITHLQGQDLFIDDTTITTSTTFLAADDIILGPDVTIQNNGIVNLKAADQISFLPTFHVIRGGQLYLYTGAVTRLDDSPNLNIPLSFSLDQNYPNPFNPRTRIRYQIPSGSDVELAIFNLLGQQVASLVNEHQPPGEYQVDWDAKRLAAGIYYYRLIAGTYLQVKKMVLVR
jgi:hypothetical protein